MRLGILSDTHDQLATTQRAIELLKQENVDAFVHCGDIAGPGIIQLFRGLTLYFVFGNHDADTTHLLQATAAEISAVCLAWGGEVSLAGRRVAICHGHLHIDVRPLLAAKPDYLLSGHSHFRQDWSEGSVRRINPGALSRADELTVAVLDLEDGSVKFLVVPENDSTRPQTTS